MELTEQEKKEYYAKWCFVALVYRDNFSLTIEKKKINFKKQGKRVVREKKKNKKQTIRKLPVSFLSSYFQVTVGKSGKEERKQKRR